MSEIENRLARMQAEADERFAKRQAEERSYWKRTWWKIALFILAAGIVLPPVMVALGLWLVFLLRLARQWVPS